MIQKLGRLADLAIWPAGTFAEIPGLPQCVRGRLQKNARQEAATRVSQLPIWLKSETDWVAPSQDHPGNHARDARRHIRNTPEL